MKTPLALISLAAVLGAPAGSVGLAGVIVLVGVVGVAVAPVARAQHGLDFVTVGAPDNPAYQQPWPGGMSVGAVPYEYKITRTEVTVAQWFEYVKAYEPYYTGPKNASAFTGVFISYVPGQGYTYNPAEANFPNDPSWHHAARFMNWLHNDKSPEAWAFENGAYDTSTFTKNPDGTRNDQITHHPGAKYWIPTDDELTKAVFYDPNRYGEGKPGYWQYPDMSDDPNTPGLPEEGGTTNAGILNPPFPYMPVGSYPWAPSPWGLLDASGGQWEWTEGLRGNYAYKDRTLFGSFAGHDWYKFVDRLENFGLWSAGPTSTAGFRVSTLIPSPSMPCLALVFIARIQRRKRK
jgi:Sulfatase-modifying factor enzyme 1